MRCVSNVFIIYPFLFTDAKVEEVFEMKLFEHDFRATGSEMHAILGKANLTGRGYKKDVVTKLVRHGDGGAPEYQACYSVCICTNVANPQLVMFTFK